MTTLRLILGDQLSTSISSLNDCDKAKDIILMCEVWQEATYVKHHKKKIAFLLSAMRHFAEELKHAGYQVCYRYLDDYSNTGSFRGEVERIIEEYSIDQIVVTEPGEYRVLDDMKTWSKALGVSVEIRADSRFLCSADDFTNWARGRKQLRMEYFYREMRKQYAVLMDGDQPVGGQWNYDADNRKPPKSGLSVPPHYNNEPDVISETVIGLVADRFDEHFCDIMPFYFAVTRQQALQALEHFIAERLPTFGDYQDAMLEGEPWMYHSHLSFYLNCGLLLPL